MSTAVVRSLKRGDSVKLGAAVGERLTLRAGDPSDLLLVAGGTGLAPLRAVVEQIDQEWRRTRRAPRVNLLHGVRMPWHLYDRAALTELARTRPWFDYTEVVSDDSSFPGIRGKVGTVAARQALHGRTAIVCGGPQMVGHTLEQLSRTGMPAEQIRYEHFYYAAAGQHAPEPALTTSGDAR